MKAVATVGRSVLSTCAGAVAAMIAFGLLLGLAWMPAAAHDQTYKLVTTLLVTAVAFTLGGYVAGRIARHHTVRAGLIFGIVFGLAACGYILGPHWYLWLAGVLTALAGAIGGRLARRPAPTL